jgi:ubiquinone/menaquinone biosynthesis C-methylase UbiE
MNESRLFHPSSRPAGHGITIGTPRLYDISANLLFFGTRRRSYRTLLEAAGVQHGNRALDIGCGPGYFARMLAEAAGPAGSAVGIDAAPEMIEYASRKARRLANCRFEVGSAESLPFPDGSFDVVVSSLMLHHLPDELRLQGVGEMKRVLRAGERCFWPT